METAMSTLPPVLQKPTLPVIGSPLFIISNPKLVIEQCKAGIVGSMPALNARPAELLDEWLAEITETLAAWDKANPDRPSAPFAINQIVHKSNDRLEHDMQVCAKYKVPIVITSLGAREDVNQAVHAWGGIVLHDVINNKFARKAVEKGADGLIAVAAGAGGHAGTKSPFALVQEIRDWFDGPLALSGSIASGGAILAAQAMGADFAYIGSAFIATHEARAADENRVFTAFRRQPMSAPTNAIESNQGDARISGMAAYEALCAEADRLRGLLGPPGRENLQWTKPFTQTLDESNAPFYKWFADGELNASANCLDRTSARPPRTRPPSSLKPTTAPSPVSPTRSCWPA
jgi:hypothetical protein